MKRNRGAIASLIVMFVACSILLGLRLMVARRSATEHLALHDLSGERTALTSWRIELEESNLDLERVEQLLLEQGRTESRTLLRRARHWSEIPITPTTAVAFYRLDAAAR